MGVDVVRIVSLSCFMGVCHSGGGRVSIGFLHRFRHPNSLRLSNAAHYVCRSIVVGGYLALLVTAILDKVSLATCTTRPVDGLSDNRLQPTNAISTANTSGLDSLRSGLTRGTHRRNTGNCIVGSTNKGSRVFNATAVCGWPRRHGYVHL